MNTNANLPAHTIVDLSVWDRGPVFRHFIDDLRCVMSMTVDLDVSRLLNSLHKRGLSFYPAMIWMVTRVLNAHDEFRYGWDDRNRLVLWERIEPYYADFRPDRQTFVKLVTPFDPDPALFHRRFLKDRKRYAALDHFDQMDVPPNTFDISCLPWIRYRSFDMHIFDSGTYLGPVVTWGKYEPVEERVLMPLSLNIHHAVADGFRLSRFFLELQELADCM